MRHTGGWHHSDDHGIRRVAGLVVAVLCAVTALAVALSPATDVVATPPTSTSYVPGDPKITTNSFEYPPGGTATVTITGFGGCPSVVITVPGTTITITVVPDEDGSFTIELPLPEEPGTYEVTATCPTTGETVTTTILVKGTTPIPTDPPDTGPPATDPPSTDPTGSTVAPTTTTAAGLPSTGSDPSRALSAAGVLLAAGVAFVLVTRIRRRSVIASDRDQG